jgi:hypothetical protein
MSDSDGNSDRERDTELETEEHGRVGGSGPHEETVSDPDIEEAHGPNTAERGEWLSAAIGLLGLWMIAQAFLFDLVASQVWNDVVVGALLLLVGGYNYARRSREEFGNVGAAALAALLGLWLVASPFVFGADGGFAETVNDLGFWNDVVVGLLALGLGAYSAYWIRDKHTDLRTTAG